MRQISACRYRLERNGIAITLNVCVLTSVLMFILNETAALAAVSKPQEPNILAEPLFPVRSKRTLDLMHDVAFDHVAGAHVLIILEGHAAFLTGDNFLHFVLEALQRRQLALVNNDVVADQANIGATLDVAVRDAATSHFADLRNIEDFEDLRI